MHWIRDREPLYDTDALAAARRKRGLGPYAAPKSSRRAPVLDPDTCFRCRKKRYDIEPGYQWCDQCRAEARAKQREIADARPDQRPTRVCGRCKVCGKAMDLARRPDRPDPELVHVACRPFLEQAA